MKCPGCVAQCPGCVAQCPRCVAQCPRCVAQCPRCVAQCPRCVAQCSGLHPLGLVCCALSLLHSMESTWSIGSIGYIGGADRTFACKSQECLWQDWYIFSFTLDGCKVWLVM